MMDGERGGILLYVTTVVFLISALALVGCGTLTFFPQQDDTSQAKFLTSRDLAAAYERIQPGVTRASQLVRIGLDSVSVNAQVLSYLGVMERFMPRSSARFDQLDAAMQDCIEARDRCTALVFRSAEHADAGLDLGLLSAIRFEPPGRRHWPQLTLLIRDGRVVFKALAGVQATPPPPANDGILSASGSVRLVPVAYRPGN